MSQFKVLIHNAVINEVAQEVGAVVELTDEQAVEFLADGRVEKVDGDQSQTQSQPAVVPGKFKVLVAYETPAVVAVEAQPAVPAVDAVEGKDAVQHNVGDVVDLTDEEAAALPAGTVEPVTQ